MDFKQVFKKLTNQNLLPPSPLVDICQLFWSFFFKASLINTQIMYNIHVLDTLLLFLKVNFTGCRLKDLYSKCSLISKGRELVVKRHKAFQSKTMLDFSEDHKFKLNAEHVNDFSLKIQIKRSAPPLQKSEFSIGITQLRFERHSSVHILFLNLLGEQK